MSDIVVVGSLNMDIVVRVPHIPVVGETILAKSINRYPGGKGANQAVAAARLDGDVQMIGKIGDDRNGQILLDNLKENHVGIEGTEKGREATGTAFINVSDKGENNIVVYPGANNHITIEQIKKHRKIIESSKICILQLEIPYEIIKYVVNLCYENKVKVIFNPAPAIENIDDEVLKKSFILIPNESELAIMSRRELNSIKEIEEAAIELCKKGSSNVIVTLGDKGSLWVTPDFVKYYDSIKVEAKDTTGAGDSFIGGLAVALTKGKTIEEAIQFATYVAALTVTKDGAQSSLPSIEEVEDFIKIKWRE